MQEAVQYDVIIVGAGLAGLYAAICGEKAGYSVLVIEGTERPGGRIKTDFIEGFKLDHGFQVLINSYPKAVEVFDFNALHLQSFESGALITDDSDTYSIGDPLRKISQLFPMIFSKVGSIGDKIKLWQLTSELQALSPDQAFDGIAMPTMKYLQKRGFSKKIISNFFVPFFGGIFLERALDTPAGMFRFVFRNFSLGEACLPKDGMEALPLQLLNLLKSTEVLHNTRVAQIDQNGKVVLSTGEILRSKKVIIACNPKPLLNQLDEAVAYRKTTTMYFSGSDKLKKMNRTIGLDARKHSPVNNYCRLDEVQPSYAPQGKSLWSVTVRDGNDAALQDITMALAELIGAKADELKHLKTYHIREALPVIATPRNDMPADQTQLTANVHLAGDYLLNGSIDAALRSGYRAAKAVTESLGLK